MFNKKTLSLPSRTSDPKDYSVLIAVARPAFQRLLEHVLQGDPGLRLVGGAWRGASPVRKAARLTPNVIIVSTRLQRREPIEVLAELKRSSPSSTLVVLTHPTSQPIPAQGADVCLPEEAVVRRLLPMIRKAASRAADRTPQPASAGSRF